jgi:ABC-2 type transport system ATP-binding protein
MDEAEYCNRIGLIYRGELIALGSPDTLKTEFMQEEVLEVVCERPQDAMGEIEKLPGVKEVALFGKGLHVVAEDAGMAISEIRSLLGTTASVEKIAPSLEDVFVSLIESRDRADQPQQEVRK